MKNLLIGVNEAQDIGAQVDKILRGLGDPDPPLDLEDVLELLRLDRHYYSSENTSALREFVSRVKVGAKQIILRPTLLLDAVKKAKLSALWVPDKKRILIDETTPQLKHRWFEAHEITHSIVDWHREFLLGDDKHTLHPSCHETLEGEANFGAGQLLFLRGRFADEALSLPRTLESVRSLARAFDNTITSTLWRTVEEAHDGLPFVGVVSLPLGHGSGRSRCKYCIESPEFKRRFFNVSESHLCDVIESYCVDRRGGPLGEDTVLLEDANGERHAFAFESFFNRYEVLTLGRYLAPSPTTKSVRSQ